MAFVLKLERKRLENEMTIDEMVGLEEGLVKVARDVLGRYVFDTEKNEYLSEKEGVKLIGKWKMVQLQEAVIAVQSGIGEAIIPFPSVPDSG